VTLYSKIPHLPGSRVVGATGGVDRRVHAAIAARFLDASRDGDRVLVTEKLDGTCVAVVREGAVVRGYGREGTPCAEARNDGRRAFATWVEAQAARFGGLGDGERLTCEWLLHAHGTRYALPHGPAVVIDGFGADGVRWPLDVVRAKAAAAGLPVAHLLHDGAAVALAAVLARLGERGHHGAIDPAEGVVYRLERGGVVLGLAKYVRPGKVDGCYLADHTGGDHVVNSWVS
jgi:hypothetical protein